MNTFSDIFKKSFLEGFNSGDITTGRILVTLGVTVVLAAYIFIVYYTATKKTFYISMALVAVITSAIILAMQSNLVISLGMVGALSIVRFRTAIKDPMDLMFLFWSISTGIICGANMYTIALLSSLIITIGLFLLELTPVGRAANLLVVSMEKAEKEEEILSAVKGFSRVCQVKSRNLSDGGMNLIVECKPVNGQELIVKIKEVEGVFGVSLMAHDGEVTV